MPFPNKPTTCPVCDKPMLDTSYVIATHLFFEEWEWVCGRNECPGSAPDLACDGLPCLPARSWFDDLPAGDPHGAGVRDRKG